MVSDDIDHIYKLIYDRAERGAPMLSNPDIGAYVGISPIMVSNRLQTLQRRGLIVIESKQGCQTRRVKVVATGRWTGRQRVAGIWDKHQQSPRAHELDELSRAVTALRRRYAPVYAETVSPDTTAKTGKYIVGNLRLERDQVIALAQRVAS